MKWGRDETNLVEGDHRNEDGSVELVELLGLVVRSRGSSFGEIEMSFGGGDSLCTTPAQGKCQRRGKGARGGWTRERRWEGGRGRGGGRKTTNRIDLPAWKAFLERSPQLLERSSKRSCIHQENQVSSRKTREGERVGWSRRNPLDREEARGTRARAGCQQRSLLCASQTLPIEEGRSDRTL